MPIDLSERANHLGCMTDTAADLYGRDFVRWAEAQAAALRAAARAGAILPLDWEHLAEEVEDLAQSQRRELRSRLGTILEHLLS
jgi:sugar (pentulose or hexulose) kinase